MSIKVSALVGYAVVVMSGCDVCSGEMLASDDLPSEKLRCLHTPDTLGTYGILGTYEYCNDFDDNGVCVEAGRPIIKLEAGGAGEFQAHAVTPQKMKWAVLGDGAGPNEIDRVDPNFRYVFVWKETEDSVADCSPTGSSFTLICDPAKNGRPTNDPDVGRWQSANFTFMVSSGNILLLGERVKKL